jgi:hypothetical protein
MQNISGAKRHFTADYSFSLIKQIGPLFLLCAPLRLPSRYECVKIKKQPPPQETTAFKNKGLNKS